MTTAPEIPADVMAAAREVVVGHLLTVVPEIHDSMRQQIDEGYFDTWPVYAVAARAILVERKRCVDAVNAERIMDAYENPADADPTDIAYDMAIDHAIDAIKRLHP